MKRFVQITILAIPLVLLAVIATGTLTPTPTSAAIDLRFLFAAQNDAQNRGDVDAVMTTFADDATVQAGGLCAMPCVGKAAIRAEIERRVAEGAQVKILSLRESSGTATGVLQVVENGFASCGVDRILVNFTFVFADEKMQSWESAPDSNDAQSAKFLECILASIASGGGGPPVITPPAAGDAGLR